MKYLDVPDGQLDEIYNVYAHMGERRTDSKAKIPGYVVAFRKAADGTVAYALSSKELSLDSDVPKDFMSLEFETSADTSNEVAILAAEEDRAAHYEVAYGRIGLN